MGIFLVFQDTLKNTPEIFFRQVFRIVWGQIYGLPGLKYLSVIGALYHPLQLLRDWEVLYHPQVKKVLYCFLFKHGIGIFTECFSHLQKALTVGSFLRFLNISEIIIILVHISQV